ncbi:MAG: AAA domain-containing protein [Promethearchaeota archaeon]
MASKNNIKKSYLFKDLKGASPSLEEPFVCILKELIEYNENEEQAIVIVEDDSGRQITGFMYKKYAEIISLEAVQKRLPFKISVLMGRLEELGGSDLIFEIHRCIFEKNTLINSSQLGGYSFCPMTTYFRTHINAETDINENQLFGMIYHDYLSIVFNDPELLKLNPMEPMIQKKVLAALRKAVFKNWDFISATFQDEDKVYHALKKMIADNEVAFVNYELDALKHINDVYKFENEKMIRSRNFGLQGRIDRLLWNITRNRFTIYETKTGKSSAASAESAKYQLIAYAIILQEYFPKDVEELILEYPRNDLKDRLMLIDYDPDVFWRLITMRNEIWAISVGYRPDLGPFQHCGRCFQKDLCSFYCLRSFLNIFCDKCEGFGYRHLLHDRKKYEEFQIANVYFDWYSEFLNYEYLANMSIKSELNLEARERERLGNCMADMKLSQIKDSKEYGGLEELGPTDIINEDGASLTSGTTLSKPINEAGPDFAEVLYHNKDDIDEDDSELGLETLEIDEFLEGDIKKGAIIEFAKSRGLQDADFKSDISGTRLNPGDYILITPQEYKPLSVETYRGIITELYNKRVLIKVSPETIESLKAYPPDTLFRIDTGVTNAILNKERSALDKILRMAYLKGNDQLYKLRTYLFNLISSEDLMINDGILISKDIYGQYLRKIEEVIEERNISELRRFFKHINDKLMADQEKEGKEGQKGKEGEGKKTEPANKNGKRKGSPKTTKTSAELQKFQKKHLKLVNSVLENLVKGSYNLEQIGAIFKALIFRGILLIQGPPGTGKTTVIVEIIKSLNELLKIKEKIFPQVTIEKSKEASKETETTAPSKRVQNNNNNDDNKPVNIAGIEEDYFKDLKIHKELKKKRILITAYTNRAVDTMFLKLIDKYPDIKIIRIGNPSSMDPKVAPYALTKLAEEEYKFLDGSAGKIIRSSIVNTIIDSAEVIAATCIGAASTILKQIRFDYVILDEAGQVVEPAALIPLLKGDNIILVGDDRQLPPITSEINIPGFNSNFLDNKIYLVSYDELNGAQFRNKIYQANILQSIGKALSNKLDELIRNITALDEKKKMFFKYLDKLGISADDTLILSVFERLKRIYKDSINYSLLKTQYRMNDNISQFISKHFYEGQIKSGETEDLKIGKRTLIDFFNSIHKKYIEESAKSAINTPIMEIYQKSPLLSGENMNEILDKLNNHGADRQNRNYPKLLQSIMTSKLKKEGTNSKVVMDRVSNIYADTFSAEYPIVFLDTLKWNSFDSKIDEKFEDINSKFNIDEAELISDLITIYLLNTKLLDAILNVYSSKTIPNKEAARISRLLVDVLKNLGVITPYRAQVRTIRTLIYGKLENALNELLFNNSAPEFDLKNEHKVKIFDLILNIIRNNLIVDTVDRFQGNESEIIIISLVDSNKEHQFGTIYDEIRRLNVSMTRAKSKLIIVGNSAMTKIDIQDLLENKPQDINNTPAQGLLDKSRKVKMKYKHGKGQKQAQLSIFIPNKGDNNSTHQNTDRTKGMGGSEKEGAKDDMSRHSTGDSIHKKDKVAKVYSPKRQIDIILGDYIVECVRKKSYIQL